jgi:hypothetical protein
MQSWDHESEDAPNQILSLLQIRRPRLACCGKAGPVIDRGIAMILSIQEISSKTVLKSWHDLNILCLEASKFWLVPNPELRSGRLSMMMLQENCLSTMSLNPTQNRIILRSAVRRLNPAGPPPTQITSYSSDDSIFTVE